MQLLLLASRQLRNPLCTLYLSRKTEEPNKSMFSCLAFTSLAFPSLALPCLSLSIVKWTVQYRSMRDTRHKVTAVPDHTLLSISLFPSFPTQFLLYFQALSVCFSVCCFSSLIPNVQLTPSRRLANVWAFKAGSVTCYYMFLSHCTKLQKLQLCTAATNIAADLQALMTSHSMNYKSNSIVSHS